MAFKGLTDNLERVVERIEDYGTSTAEYYKLRLFKSTMKFSTALVNMLVIGFIAFLFLIFISIGGAVYLSALIGNPFFWIFDSCRFLSLGFDFSNIVRTKVYRTENVIKIFRLID